MGVHERKRQSHPAVPLRSSALWWLLNGVLFSLIAVYLVAIVLRESVEGHVSSGHSWIASTVIGLLAVMAAWRAVRSWRRLATKRRP